MTVPINDTTLNDDGDKLNKGVLSLPARLMFPQVIESDAKDPKTRTLYLNACFQQPLSKVVYDACAALLHEHLTLPHPKPTWTAGVELARDKVASLIGAKSVDVAFMKNTSDGLNAFAQSLDLQPGDNVVVLDGEHPNQTYAWLSLERRGVQVRRIPQVNYADAGSFLAATDDRTRAVGLSWIMFHSGQKNDVEGICAVMRTRDIHVLVDATQAAGVYDLGLDSICPPPSAVAFGCHKGLGTPTGCAVLWVDPGVSASLVPAAVGPFGVTNCGNTLIAGPTVDLGVLKGGAGRFEYGNYSYVALNGLAAYVDLLERCGGMSVVENYLYTLSGYLIDAMAGLGIATVAERDDAKRAPHNVVFRLKDPGWGPFMEANHCLVSNYRDGMRVSFGIYNTTSDVDRFLQLVHRGLEHLPSA